MTRDQRHTHSLRIDPQQEDRHDEDVQQWWWEREIEAREKEERRTVWDRMHITLPNPERVPRAGTGTIRPLTVA